MGPHGLLQAGTGEPLHFLELVEGEDEATLAPLGEAIREGQDVFLEGEAAAGRGADIQGEGRLTCGIRPDLRAQPPEKVPGQTQQPFRSGLGGAEHRLGDHLEQLGGGGGPEGVHVGDEDAPGAQPVQEGEDEGSLAVPARRQEEDVLPVRQLPGQLRQLAAAVGKVLAADHGSELEGVLHIASAITHNCIIQNRIIGLCVM